MFGARTRGFPTFLVVLVGNCCFFVVCISELVAFSEFLRFLFSN